MDHVVSCIIPTRNRAELIKRAVNSVLNQTYRNLEIIIVDNDSTDDTPHVISTYLEQDSRIRTLQSSSTNTAAATRNLGLEIARGKYVAFLDDDDEWLPSKIECQLPYADHYSVVGCFSGYNGLRKTTAIKDIVCSLEDFHLNNQGLNPTTILLRADNIRNIGGFDPQFRGPEGIDLVSRLIATYGPALIIKKQLTIHHVNHGKRRLSLHDTRANDSQNELEKNWHLRSAKAYQFRRYSIELQKAFDSPTTLDAIGHTLRALSYIDFRYPKLYWHRLAAFGISLGNRVTILRKYLGPVVNRSWRYK